MKSEHLAVNGLLTFEIVLTKDGTKIMSFPHFILNVVDSLHDEDVFTPSEDDLSILWEVIDRMQNAMNNLDGRFEQFEQEKELEFQANEANRLSTFTQSENARQSTFTQNEAQRASVFEQSENSRQQAENTRQSQESARQQAETLRQETFEGMQDTVQEVYSTTLKYRIVE